MGRLTVGLVERAKAGKCAPGKYRDGNELTLVIGPRSASWVFRYQINGRRRELGLGPLQLLGLARARELAQQHRVRIRIDRIDPVVDRRAHRQTAARHSVTFAQAVDQFIKQQVSMNAWRNPRGESNWRTSLANHAKPLIALRVCDITAADVEDVLRPIWATKTSTAIIVRGRIEKVWTFAKRRGWCDGENPAVWRGGLEANLPKPRQVKPENQPRKAAPWRSLPSVYRQLAASDDLVAAFIRFTILTAARPGEAANATWTDIDLEAREWTTSGARMKAGRTHIVPLSDEAVAIINGLPRVSDRLFPKIGKRTYLKALRSVSGIGDVTLHGTARSCFDDWGTTNGVRDKVLDYSLAHYPTNFTVAAYRRESLLQERAPVMEHWAGFLRAGEVTNVVRLAA